MSIASHAPTKAPAGFRNWCGILCPEPPSAYYLHDELLVQAQAMLATRERNFPMMVQRRDMTGEEAESQMRVFRLIVADLQWIIASNAGADTGEIPITEADRKAICDALDNSVETIGQIAAESGNPIPQQLSDQAHDVIAMRWNFDPARGRIGSPTEMHGVALINREFRKSQQRKAVS
jgi:hypothetical protein